MSFEGTGGSSVALIVQMGSMVVVVVVGKHHEGTLRYEILGRRPRESGVARRGDYTFWQGVTTSRELT